VEKLGYSIEEAADACGVGRTVMCGLIRDGEIKSIKIGRRRIVPAESVREYMRELIESQNGETVGTV
jgi:excisionase family DNA binding protein